MNHLLFTTTPTNNYPYCFLVPSIRKEEIQKEYISASGINPDDVLVLDLHYSKDKKKTPAAEIKEYFLSEIVPVLEDNHVKYLAVADSDYFKVLTKSAKVEVHLGYVLDCVLGPWKVIYVPSYKAVFYDPDKVRAKIKQGLDALTTHAMGIYEKPGSDIIKFQEYPETIKDISDWLAKLLRMDCPLSIDIEAFDLKHHKAGIASITFCWNKNEGIAFAVDYSPIIGATEVPFGENIKNEPVRVLLKQFFKNFFQKAIYHNIAYDVYILIYQLFMDDILDTKGMLNGLDVMLDNWDDTKLITYLATNSCAGNKLGLKDQSQEYSGNYAQEEIKDVTRIPLPQLLTYNLIDGLSTWYTYEKHWDTLVNDQQEDIYNSIFKPATKDIIQMQLTGLPVDMKRVIEVKKILTDIETKALDVINTSKVVQRFTYRMNEEWVIEKNLKLKKKQVTLADAKEVFNPNSNKQLQKLLFEMLGLPILSYTDSKQPSTDGDTIRGLVSHTSDPDTLGFLNSLLDYSAVYKILSSFIPAIEGAALGSDGWHYLFGNFNLGGTLSGRLSSSNPNLQNLPSSNTASTLAKLIVKLVKSCFVAPPGWIFAGLDFASLEDKISALTTKDPNKIKVYTDGYDGHSLRAFFYFRESMVDIEENVESINSIQKKYKDLRFDSKAPTFALTYQGTYKTLMTNCGFSEEKAKMVEARYHDLYVVSDKWVADKLNQASKVGYVTVAFGLRVRTPLLHQVIRGNSRTPYEAEAEGRTAGNALGQSWCMLNSRASIEFMEKVRSSKHSLDIRPCAQIHDAQYYLIRDNLDAVMFTNKHLVDAVKWQEHPDIQHDLVKLGGELSLFWPDWAHEVGIPNEATEQDICSIVEQHILAI